MALLTWLCVQLSACPPVTFNVLLQVWNPWSESPLYANFVCVQNVLVDSAVCLQPGEEWEGATALYVRDVVIMM